MKLRTLKAISLLLHYPDQELLDHLEELQGAIEDDTSIKIDLEPLFKDFKSKECTDLDESYVALFDCGRGSSLYLFEHVHGESRQRGQAMVDLISMYEKDGFKIPENELPDYLPIFLEYASQLSEEKALELLKEVSHLLRNIGENLGRKGSYYYLLCSALLEMAGEKPVEIDFKPADFSSRPIDYEAIDKEWAEEPVTFSNQGSGPREKSSPQCNINRHSSK